MANPEHIEEELRAYLEAEPNLRRQDRLKHLKAIFDKHFGLEETGHLLNTTDLHDIVSYAKAAYATTKMPMNIGRKPVPNNEINHVLIIESFIMYLNKNKLLKKLVKFDHTR